MVNDTSQCCGLVGLHASLVTDRSVRCARDGEDARGRGFGLDVRGFGFGAGLCVLVRGAGAILLVFGAGGT
jgi:hypothetical protein